MNYDRQKIVMEQLEDELRDQRMEASRIPTFERAIEKARATNRGMLQGTLERMLALETEGVQRAAKRKNFLLAVEQFYDQHTPRLSDALAPLVEQASALGVRLPDGIAVSHIAESKELLLAAAECQREELQERIADCTAAWPARIVTYLDTEDSIHAGT
jgi:hypothetical protein